MGDGRWLCQITTVMIELDKDGDECINVDGDGDACVYG
jgi:hypothetical protein